ncbi:acetate uptake transporter [Vibrio gallicus]|uniref:acetate uptake transporter n=1 Tax=Vibrio gallicus TaxID=190897 RepID=UPI0021C37671|nr:acetate uptake transporter [Vibrio gallicus]
MSKQLANPAPLGLMGFGMTTVLLNIHNAGLFPLDSMILAMGIFYGGLGQVLVGMMCFKRGDTFGTTAFTSYGLFWLTVVGLIALPKMGFPASPAGFMGCFFALWGIFTGFLYIGSLRYPFAKQVVFASLTILFFLLAAHEFTENSTLGFIAGIEGIFCGASAMYFAFAQILNAEYGRVILPVGSAKYPKVETAAA